MAIIRLQKARIAFPQLFEAEQFQGQGPYSYRATFLIAPPGKCEVKQDDGTWKPTTMQAVIDEIAKAEFKAQAGAVLKSIKDNSQKCCYVDGSTKTWSGAEGSMVLSASRDKTKRAPTVKDRAGNAITEDDGTVYGGCYVHATVEMWAQNNEYGKGIRATLRGVQFAADGDAFSAGSRLDDTEFDDLSVGADAEDLVG